jgi:Aspartyl/Asparaginyl beta-hydroxylase.
METVKKMENVGTLNNKVSSDFYHVPNLKFDVKKLRSDLEKILKQKNFNSLGIKNFGAIPVNQIPGDKSSIEGHNVRGTYWTIPDESGKEAMRDKPIDESKYTELLPEFKGTYFEHVFNTLKENFKLGRVRILLKEPRSTLSWHRDPEPRLHVPIITNKGCRMVIEEVSKHMPADGTVTITNNTKYHNFFNGGEQNRIHLVACVLENPFNNNGRIQ